MNFEPSLETFLQLAQQGNLIPVCTDLMADYETPVSVYDKLQQRGAAFLLESIEGGSHLNRYSFIGFEPNRVIQAQLGGETTITERIGEHQCRPTPSDPLTLIEEELRRYQPVMWEGLPPFVGGAVGYIGYEYAHCVEPTVPLATENPLGMPVIHFMVTDTLVVFDRARQTLRLLRNAATGEDPEAAYQETCIYLEELASFLREGRPVATLPLAKAQPPATPPEGNFEKASFENMVRRCKEYICAGDIIQVVGSQRFGIPFEASPLELYRTLRIVNPSPYMFLYDCGDFALIGASPEVHVRLTERRAELRPIAGTRPRGKNPSEDRALEADLLADEKERAEHLMLVDLARNDLGRVCEFGSVKVPEYMVVEHYSHVMHIVSQVEGRLASGRSAADLMRATFPAGTVSGAPKVRAMQIIAEQERDQRGPYAGAVAYFSYGGNLDSCIAIRTALLKNKTLHVQAGAGLVADSIPSNEYFETLNKAMGLFTAASLAQNLSPTRKK